MKTTLLVIAGVYAFASCLALLTLFKVYWIEKNEELDEDDEIGLFCLSFLSWVIILAPILLPMVAIFYLHDRVTREQGGRCGTRSIRSKRSPHQL